MVAEFSHAVQGVALADAQSYTALSIAVPLFFVAVLAVATPSLPRMGQRIIMTVIAGLVVVLVARANAAPSCPVGWAALPVCPPGKPCTVQCLPGDDAPRVRQVKWPKPDDKRLKPPTITLPARVKL